LKRQTLIMLVACVVLGVGLAVSTGTLRRLLVPSGPVRTVSFGEATLEVPDSFRAPTHSRFENWEQLSLPGTSGRLLLAWEPADQRPLAQAYARWFHMPAYSRGPIRYEAGPFRWFYREIPLFGQGGYALQKRGKSLRLIACFAQGGRHYWVHLDTPNASTQVQRAFHQMVLSLRLPDGSSPEATLAAALDGIPRECGWRFVMPMELPFLVPLAALLAIFGVQLLLRKRAGRLPEHPVGFTEANLEISISRPLQIQFMEAAVGVTGEALTIYTFGSPLLVVPRSALAGRVSTGQGWFGARYVQLDLEGPLDLRKWKWKYRSDRGAKLRIYTQDVERLHCALRL